MGQAYLLCNTYNLIYLLSYLMTPYRLRFSTACNVYFLILPYQISLHHNTATKHLNVDKIISLR